jgi:ABC-2 type transport system ATP-binding protein
MIELENLSKTYAKKATRKGAKAARPAVDALSLEIRSGEIFGFLGPNGAGKTTTIKMLTGVLKPDSGKVRIDGIELSARPLEAKARFGYVGDNPELWNRLKAAEFLNFMADVYGVPDSERRERIERYARRFSIADALGAPISGYSRGMKQKLCIVASLLHEAAFELKALMRERTAAGASVFFSTHVMEVAEKLCDRIGVISGGKLVFVGRLDELREKRAVAGDDVDGDESLERLFLDLVEEERATEAKA